MRRKQSVIWYFPHNILQAMLTMHADSHLCKLNNPHVIVVVIGPGGIDMNVSTTSLLKYIASIIAKCLPDLVYAVPQC